MFRKSKNENRARVAQLEEIRGCHVRGSEEVAEHIRSCVEDVLPSSEQDLACCLDDRQTELRDALDMADMESASAITSLITRGLAKMASFVPPPSVGEASHPGPSSSEDEFLVHEELLDCLQQDLLPGSREFGGGSETMMARMPFFGVAKVFQKIILGI